MQGIMETIFDACYLITVVSIGVWMVKNSNGRNQYLLFGVMAILLGFGDAFHLVPRAYGLLTNGLESNAVALGVGKLITSITMTIFYVILYHIWRIRYQIKDKHKLTLAVYILAVIRIVLCLSPSNQWLLYNAPLSWAIYRNIPFAILGIIVIIIYYIGAKKADDRQFKFMWFAVTLSFAFYVPVVLFSDVLPIVGILMIPKTLAYVWIVFMGFSEQRKIIQESVAK